MYFKSFKFFKFFNKYLEYSDVRYLYISVSNSNEWVNLIPCITIETNVFNSSIHQRRIGLFISIGFVHLTVYIQIFFS